MHVSGRCHCGAIEFSAEVDPERVGICHCTDCQQLSGSPYRIVAPVNAEDLSISGGEPTIYIRTADSGGRWAIAFCPVCGTPVHAADEDRPTTYSLRVGTLDQREQLVPKIQIWCNSAMPWAMDLGEVDKLARQ